MLSSLFPSYCGYLAWVRLTAPEQGDVGLGSLRSPPQRHTATAGTSTAHPRKHFQLALPNKPRHDAEGAGWELPTLNTAAPIPKSPLLHVSSRLFFPLGAPHLPPQMSLLYSVSFLLVVLSFLMISCFLDFTMAELLSVSLLKKAGG